MKKTVKKVFALFMALAISISVLSVIPVSAADAQGYPLTFYDMEDMNTSKFSIEEGGIIEAVAGGVGASEGCLKVVNGNYATDAGQTNVCPTLAFKGSYGDVLKDGIMQVSFWLFIYIQICLWSTITFRLFSSTKTCVNQSPPNIFVLLLIVL